MTVEAIVPGFVACVYAMNGNEVRRVRVPEECLDLVEPDGALLAVGSEATAPEAESARLTAARRSRSPNVAAEKLAAGMCMNHELIHAAAAADRIRLGINSATEKLAADLAAEDLRADRLPPIIKYAAPDGHPSLQECKDKFSTVTEFGGDGPKVALDSSWLPTPPSAHTDYTDDEPHRFVADETRPTRCIHCGQVRYGETHAGFGPDPMRSKLPPDAPQQRTPTSPWLRPPASDESTSMLLGQLRHVSEEDNKAIRSVIDGRCHSKEFMRVAEVFAKYERYQNDWFIEEIVAAAWPSGVCRTCRNTGVEPVPLNDGGRDSYRRCSCGCAVR